MVKLTASRSEIIKFNALLEDTPQRLAVCTEGLSEVQLRQAPAEGEWSVVEILAHLRACQEVWTYSIYAMLALDHPTLALVHPRQWARVTEYQRLEFRHSLQAFSLRRQELIGTLQDLSEEDWERRAVIENREHSVFSQVRRMALHEAGHCDQIESLLVASGLLPR